MTVYASTMRVILVKATCYDNSYYSIFENINLFLYYEIIISWDKLSSLTWLKATNNRKIVIVFFKSQITFIFSKVKITSIFPELQIIFIFRTQIYVCHAYSWEELLRRYIRFWSVINIQSLILIIIV